MQSGAGQAAAYLDADCLAAGVSLATDAAATIADADVVLAVRALPVEALAGLKFGAIVAAMLDAYAERPALDALVGVGATGFAMGFLPRISRAQSMDVPSSQAKLAGYPLT